MSVERQPLANRVSDRLEKHGLSFSDALNVLLFLLTIISLYFAYAGVKVARVALNESNREEAEHKQEERQQEEEHTAELLQQEAKAAQTEKLEDTRFREQLRELKSSTSALDQARSLLGQQAHTLQDLQKISTKQLEDLDRAEKRANAAPRPGFSIRCNGTVVIQVGELEGDIAENPNHTSPVQVSTSFNSQGLIPCRLFFENDGDAELQDAKVKVRSSCTDFHDYQHPAATHFLLDTTQIGDSQHRPPLQSEVSLLNQNEVLPISVIHEVLGAYFTIAHAGSCHGVELVIDFAAKNHESIQAWGDIRFQPSTDPIPVWDPAD